MSITEDPLYLEIAELIDGVYKRYAERTEIMQQKIKASKKNTAIQTKIAQEQRLNAELRAKLAEASKRGHDMDKICAKFASGVTISENDRHRLESVKEMVDIGKKLTGIRFDFSAPPDAVNGYIKYERNRTLTPFKLTPQTAEAELWNLLGECSSNKENQYHN